MRALCGDERVPQNLEDIFLNFSLCGSCSVVTKPLTLIHLIRLIGRGVSGNFFNALIVIH